jgi:hypothetical protein
MSYRRSLQIISYDCCRIDFVELQERLEVAGCLW